MAGNPRKEREKGQLLLIEGARINTQGLFVCEVYFNEIERKARMCDEISKALRPNRIKTRDSAPNVNTHTNFRRRERQ